jgi:magnesium transporter
MQRIADLADSLRDTLTSALEVHYSTAQQRANDTIKVLTVIATVFLPVYLLTGIYGMNFESIPEFAWRYGYLFFWGLAGLTTLAMFWFIKTRKWL